ncbi:hypothetical protein [Corynebacterium sp. LK2510]|uniref:hypothetical protein n=1 Tax=Corynebacterium sp. LK2510 TaxID=3110472 RepID=UPI0034CEF060
MAHRRMVVAGAMALSIGSASLITHAPAAFAAQWQDATVAPGATVVLKAIDGADSADQESEAAGVPAHVTLVNSDVLPAGWSVVSLAGEVRVSAPATAKSGDSIVLALEDGDSTVDELKVTVEDDSEAVAPETAPASETVRGSLDGGTSGGSWISLMLDRIGGLFS